MSESYRRVKGTRDLLPPETAVWAAVEATARSVFGRYAYREIRTPIIEHTELFVRSVGESTDIVGKEMYTFADRKGRSLTLRPESTASVARAFVENGMTSWPQPVKLFYIGPQFRYERPQKGRYRQFHQIGAELLGDASPLADVELLLMLNRFLQELGFEDLVVLVNTVGDEASRQAYRASLVGFLTPRRDALSEDSQRRLESNPLRILDSKSPGDREQLEGAPELHDSLTPEAREHFDQVRAGLDAQGMAYRVENRLVRGLDYYTHTVFEIVSEGLGAQDALVGGGRYDGLVAALGGGAVPGIGFAIGEDRLLDVLPESFQRRFVPASPTTVVAVGEVSPMAALALAEELRSQGVECIAELTTRSLKSSMKRADRHGVERVLLLGEEEMESGRVTLRDLRSGRQGVVLRDRLAAVLTSDDFYEIVNPGPSGPEGEEER
ncbi:MAG: histidine--tRNA ligase [Thermoanaerobaculia bacterium]|nr:histidine--tRNA ligase [Thermoanaerobaculia bacterium]